VKRSEKQRDALAVVAAMELHETSEGGNRRLSELPLPPCGGDSEAWPCAAGLSGAREGSPSGGREVGVDPSPRPSPARGPARGEGDLRHRYRAYNIGALRRRIAAMLGERSDTPALDARFLVAHALDCSARDLALLDDKPVAENVVATALALAERRRAGEPVGRIIGEREFWGLPFSLTPATLEPRPDTETVVSAALAAFAARRDEALTILDLGTGTGAILLALLSELPRASGHGVDRDFGAAATARLNAGRLGLADRATFLVGNWADAVAGGFDLVVSNPPYIPSQEIDSLALEVRGFDPHIALDGGKDGLNGYHAIIPDLERIVKRDGRAFLEVGAGQLEMVRELAVGQGFAAKGHRDLAGIGRVVELALA
jgi:release factor glutamine methyltransferase